MNLIAYRDIERSSTATADNGFTDIGAGLNPATSFHGVGGIYSIGSYQGWTEGRNEARAATARRPFCIRFPGGGRL